MTEWCLVYCENLQSVIDILFVGWLYFAGYNFVGHNLNAGYVMAYFFEFTNLGYNRVNN